VDDDWASVGTANLDNRSLHLNFEVNADLLAAGGAELEAAFRHDLTTAIRLDRACTGGGRCRAAAGECVRLCRRCCDDPAACGLALALGRLRLQRER